MKSSCTLWLAAVLTAFGLFFSNNVCAQAIPTDTTVVVELETTDGNTFIGELTLSGLRPAPRGEVAVVVTFQLDANGTVRVLAMDTGTQRETQAVLQLVGVAGEASVHRMAAAHSQERIGVPRP